jgi:hypothetical protein
LKSHIRPLQAIKRSLLARERQADTTKDEAAAVVQTDQLSGQLIGQFQAAPFIIDAQQPNYSLEDHRG